MLKSLLRNHKQMKLILCIHVYDISLYINCVFYSGLVAMATYIFHRHILGRVDIDNFFCLNGDIFIFFTEMCIK